MPSNMFPAFSKQNRKPERHVVPVIGGWNPDATETSIPPTDFVEMKNIRKMRPEECETRSGYKQYIYPGNYTPLALAEFRLGETFVDVAFYSDTVNLFALVMNPVTTPTGDVTIFLGQYGANPTVCATQFNTYLIVSITSTLESPNDAGLFALSPPYDSGTKQPDFTETWNKIALGKEVCPTPVNVSYQEKIAGSLFVYNSTNDNGSMKLIPDPLTGLPATIPIQVSIPYWRSGGTDINPATNLPWVDYMKERLFVQANDESSLTSGFDKHKHTHPESRAWGYRFVFVRTITDAKGQKQFVESHPSADVWVRDNIYCPPVLGMQDLDVNGKIKFTDLIYGNDVAPDGDDYSQTRKGSYWRDDPGSGEKHDVMNAQHRFTVGDGIGGNTSAKGYPSNEDYLDLRNKFRASDISNVTVDPYFFTAVMLGWWVAPETKFPGAIYPYQTAVPVSKIKSAPCTIFNWSDFTSIASDSSVTEIRVYRTAHSEQNEADNATKSPAFAPHRFGYVGSITPGGSFTDDIADTNIDFGTTPTLFNGYLTSQLAGQVIRVYEDHIVLGNTVSKHWKLEPTNLIQAFTYKSIDTPFVFGAFNTNPVAPDGLPFNQLFYSYVDRDGNESDAIPIAVDTSDHDLIPPTINVMLVFPRGYSVEVTSVNLYRSVYGYNFAFPGRHLFKVATVPVTTSFYNLVNFVTPAMEVTGVTQGEDGSLLLKTTETSRDPGYIIWSEANQMFFWPQENIENEHDQNPITHLDSVIGPLYCFSDKGVNMTRLTGYREPVTDKVGCIGRNCAFKVDKVVFFLSAYGLYYVEGSGVQAFPAYVQTEVIKYLRESIEGVAPLTNVKRAAMGWLGQRNELWLSLPNSSDLGGALPSRTFIYKFLEGTNSLRVVNYEFDLATANPVRPVIYLAHADGKLFCAYHQSNPFVVNPETLVIQDNDTDDIWTGKTYLQYQNPMGQAHLDKKLDGLEWIAEGRGDISFCTGVTRTDGGREQLHGTIKPQARIRKAKVLDAGYTQFFKVPLNGPEIETKGRPPAVRFITEPNAKGEHMVKFKSLELSFTYEHNHR